jgi:hypothetical protein
MGAPPLRRRDGSGDTERPCPRDGVTAPIGRVASARELFERIEADGVQQRAVARWKWRRPQNPPGDPAEAVGSGN